MPVTATATRHCRGAAAALAGLALLFGVATSAAAQGKPPPAIDRMISAMTLEQKLGQMMIAEFQGPSFSRGISTMIGQYGVGAVILYSINGNIQSKAQLKTLIAQMQAASAVPLLVTIDQEGGTVDRLLELNGQRPPASVIGATNNPEAAKAAGARDAEDLALYGFNLNFAPVVDVTTARNKQLHGRTYGNNPDVVTRMAAAYLQGLQQGGKVFGVLKHFPGLGGVAADPHKVVPDLDRSRDQLEAVDWAPYRALIAQGGVHAIMVSHELVRAIDPETPSTLSQRLLDGILRHDMGFDGLVVADNLKMQGVKAYHPLAEATVLAIRAGNDALMAASEPKNIVEMTAAIKRAIESGVLDIARIDRSVRRILTLKAKLGLLSAGRSPPSRLCAWTGWCSPLQ